MPVSAKKYETHLLQALALADENEREKIARKIHAVNTLLSLVKMNVKKAARHVGNKKTLEEIARENTKVLEESMRMISAAVRELSPPMFTAVGYVASLTEWCRRLCEEGECKIQVGVDALREPFKVQNELPLYRLSIQIIQHFVEAGAKNIRVVLEAKRNKHQIRFEHDGRETELCGKKQQSLSVRAALAAAKLRCGKKWIEVSVSHGKKD